MSDNLVRAMQARIKALEKERDAAMEHIETITIGAGDHLVNGVSTLCAIIADYRSIYNQQCEKITRIEHARSLWHKAYNKKKAARDSALNELDRIRQDYALAMAENATLKRERDAALSDLGELLTLLRYDPGVRPAAYRRALELVGAVPDGEISAPNPPTCEVCGMPIIAGDIDNEWQHWLCSEHGVQERKVAEPLPFEETPEPESEHAPDFTSEPGGLTPLSADSVCPICGTPGGFHGLPCTSVANRLRHAND